MYRSKKGSQKKRKGKTFGDIYTETDKNSQQQSADAQTKRGNKRKI